MRLDPQSPYQLVQETPGGLVYKVFKSGSFRGYLSKCITMEKDVKGLKRTWSAYDKNNNHLWTFTNYREALEAF